MSFSSTLGCAFCSSAIFLATSAATTTSLAPLAREMAKATTGAPSRAAKVRGSAVASVTEPSWSRRTLRPRGSDDRGGGEVFHRLLAGQRADRLLAPADLAAAAGQVDVGGPELPVDVAGGDAEGEQPVGIERDADLALDAAEALDLRDALHALQRAHHGVVDEPGQLLGRHARRACRVGDDRQALDLDARDDRLVDGARQLGADARDGVLHVVERAVLVDLQAELDGGDRRAFGDRRGLVLDAVDAGDGVLDLLGDLHLELGRRGARLVDAHLHDRHVDVGKARDRQLAEADVAERHQHHEQHQRRHRLADRPGRDVPVHGAVSTLSSRRLPALGDGRDPAICERRSKRHDGSR